MWHRVMISVRLFAMLFEKIPMIEAQVLLPSVILLIAFPVLTTALPETPDRAFVAAFVVMIAVRVGLRWGKAAREIAVHFGRFGAHVILLGLVSGVGLILIWLEHPSWCQHLYSLICAGYAALLTIDLLDKSHFVVSKMWPDPVLSPFHRAISAALLVLQLALILLNETIIRVAPLWGWVVFFALQPMLFHVLMHATLRTAIWFTPSDDQGHQR